METTVPYRLMIPFSATNHIHSNSIPLTLTPPKLFLVTQSDCPPKCLLRLGFLVRPQFSRNSSDCPPICLLRLGFLVRPQFSRNSFSDDGDFQTTVEELRVPDHWLEPSKALEESEWLRFSLQKWLDDEYCPEPTNVDISRVAAHSYYRSLLEKTTDLGEILLKMARQLESISYQESFHGAFSSANAAVSLIAQRIEQVN